MSTSFVAGRRVVDLAAARVVNGAETTPLTPLECAFLGYLYGLDGAAASRADLLVEVWGYNPSVQSRAVGTALARLRKKLEDDPAHPRYLVSKHGVGVALQGVVAADADADLVGRESDLVALSPMPERGLLVLVGLPGSGRRTLAEALFPGASVLQASGLDSTELAEQLDQGADIVLDAHPASFTVLDRAARARPIIATATQGEGAARVHVVGQLSDVASRDLVGTLLGQEVSSEVVDQLLELGEGHPQTLLWLVPLVGLLGRDLDAVVLDLGEPGDTNRDRMAAVWEALAPDLRDVLLCWSVFEGAFELAAGAAAAGLSMSQAVAVLGRLQRHALIEGGAGWLRLPGLVRRYARTLPGDREQVDARLSAWFEEQAASLMLRDTARTRRYRFDLCRLVATVPDPAAFVPLVFVGAVRGGWVAEAKQAIARLQGLFRGELGTIVGTAYDQIERLLEYRPVEPPVMQDVSGLGRGELFALGMAAGQGAPAELLDALSERLAQEEGPMEVWLRLVIASQMSMTTGRQYLEPLARLAHRNGWSEIEHAAAGLLALRLAAEGDDEAARRTLDAAEQLGVEDHSLFLPRVRTWVGILAGELERCARHLLELERDALDHDLPAIASGVRCTRAWVALASGDEAKALRLVEDLDDGDDVLALKASLRREFDELPPLYASLYAAHQRGEALPLQHGDTCESMLFRRVIEG